LQRFKHRCVVVIILHEVEKILHFFLSRPRRPAVGFILIVS
jgi:hypothetical protein